jgi:hypothetical protein
VPTLHRIVSSRGGGADRRLHRIARRMYRFMCLSAAKSGSAGGEEVTPLQVRSLSLSLSLYLNLYLCFCHSVIRSTLCLLKYVALCL